MDDAPAFVPQSQSEYAFPSTAGDSDDADQAAARNQQIQAAFDTQRMQHNFIQGLGKEIAQVRQRQAQKAS